jgi:hypothetical protein
MAKTSLRVSSSTDRTRRGKCAGSGINYVLVPGTDPTLEVAGLGLISSRKHPCIRIYDAHHFLYKLIYIEATRRHRTFEYSKIETNIDAVLFQKFWKD